MWALTHSMFALLWCQEKPSGVYKMQETAPPQPLPYLMPIPPNTLFYNKKFITAFLSLGLGNSS